MIAIDSRRDLLRAALGFLAFEPREPELRLLHDCFAPGAGSAISSPGWRARSTTLSSGATMAGAGARSSSRADSTIL
jgi:hypothetical protein